MKTLIPTCTAAPLLAAWIATAPAATAAEALKPPLAGLDFLLGRWTTVAPASVAETGGSATGTSVFSAEAGGEVLLRRDRTELRGRDGAPAGGFDQLMTVWPEGGAPQAVYADGTHLIRYTHAEVEPGRAVTFTSDAGAGTPAFRLAYRLTTPGVLAVSFGLLPPGGSAVRPIAVGELRKAP